MKKESGQVILILILVMTVALSIGLSIVQKSLVDLSTASKVEQSSRAFSAAEAGIEQALTDNGSIGVGATSSVSFLGNQSRADVDDAGLIPAVPTPGSRQAALEIPPLAKEDTAQVWLADYSLSSNPPPAFYAQPTLEVYWGDFLSTDKAAIELTLVYYNGSTYLSRKWYLDPDTSRPSPNGFDSEPISVRCAGYVVGTKTYQCKKILGDNNGTNNSPLPNSAPNILMLLRFRLLYNTTSQPIAVWAAGTCPSIPCTSYSLPPQARSITSTGKSGETQRKVQLFQSKKLVPPYFDYAIFSSGEINK